MAAFLRTRHHAGGRHGRTGGRAFSKSYHSRSARVGTRSTRSKPSYPVGAPPRSTILPFPITDQRASGMAPGAGGGSLKATLRITWVTDSPTFFCGRFGGQPGCRRARNGVRISQRGTPPRAPLSRCGGARVSPPRADRPAPASAPSRSAWAFLLTEHQRQAGISRDPPGPAAHLPTRQAVDPVHPSHLRPLLHTDRPFPPRRSQTIERRLETGRTTPTCNRSGYFSQPAQMDQYSVGAHTARRACR